MEKVQITPELNKKRLDACLSELLPEISRNQLKNYIEEGFVKSKNGDNITPATKVKTGDVFTVKIPEVREAEPEAQDIPLDIVYEDDDLLVVNKEVGMVVHPAAGNYDGTLVNAILFHCKDSLSGIGGVQRPGIVHRLDKDTSGLMIVAKNDKAHKHLSKQLEKRKLSRVYSAIVWGNPSPSQGVIQTNIGRSKTNRKKMSVLGEDAGKEAITNYKTLKTFERKLCLVECKLETGRTHQIRVHMTHIGCPLLGDQVYGRNKLGKYKFTQEQKDVLQGMSRQALHAREISFIHPTTKEEMTFSCEMPGDMQKVISVFS
jgi:23S rRNA pseudouridine1911/1915/1917 synthase